MASRRRSHEELSKASVGDRARGRRAARPSIESLERRSLLAASVSEFPLRYAGGSSDYTAIGADNNVWFTEYSNNVGEYDPSTGKVVGQYPIPTPNSNPGPIILGPDNKLWFIEAATNQFGVVTSSNGAVAVSEVPVLAAVNPQIQDLASGSPDGDIYFTEYKAGKIGRINPTTHAVEQYSIPTLGSEPYGITYDPVDGDYWFTESGANRVGMLNPTTHQITEYVISTTSTVTAEGITADASGNLWYVEAGANAIGMLNPSNPGSPATYTSGLTANAGLLAITKGPDNNLWFTEAKNQAIGMIAASGGAIKEYHASAPAGIVAMPGGNLYFGVQNNNLLGSITTAGVVSGIPVPTTYVTGPNNIVADEAGDLWFGMGNQVGIFDPVTHYSTEIADPKGNNPFQFTLDTLDGSIWYLATGDTINRVDPSPTHAITSYALDSFAGPQALVYDPKDGFFWFTEGGGNRVGYFDPATRDTSDNFLSLPNNANPLGITVDGSDNLWWTEPGTRQLGEYNLSSQTPMQVALTTGFSPQYIALAKDGTLWYTSGNGANLVGEIEPANNDAQARYAVPGHDYDGVISGTYQITSGPDGQLWMTTTGEFGNIPYIDSIDPTTHAVIEYDTKGGTQGITSGKDGNVWFTEGNVNEAGSIDLAPSATAAGVTVTTPPPADVTQQEGFGVVVRVTNAQGNADTFYNGPVSIALGTNPSQATLGGTATVNAVNGVASFPGLALDKAGTGYTIVATADGFTSPATPAFTVTLAAVALVVSVEPPSAFAAGTPFGLTVEAIDPDGNVDTSYDGTVALTLQPSGDGQKANLDGTTILGVDNGVVQFAGLSLDNYGMGYTITASDTESQLTATTTSPFTVKPYPATHLVIRSQPSSVVAGSPFTLDIAAENDQGTNPVDFDYNGTVALVLAVANNDMLGGDGNAILTFSQGVATYTGVTLSKVSPGDVIIATSGSLTPARSAPIVVTTPGAASIMASAGTPQSQTVATAFATQLQATVLDKNGNPVPGVVVTFNSPTSGPSGNFAGLRSATATTNALGVATAPAFTAGILAASYIVTATVPGVSAPATFSLTNKPGAASVVVATAGTPQSAVVGTAFATAPQATVEDRYGNPVPGVVVAFNSPTSGPSGNWNGLRSATATTGAAGVATAPPFTAGILAASYIVTATVPGVSAPATFSLTNKPGAASMVVATAGTPQSAVDGTAFAIPLQATVEDRYGNPVAGVVVTFNSPTSGPSGNFAGLRSATATTNAAGLATAPAFTAGLLVGSYTVTATAFGGPAPASYSLANRVGAASILVATAGTPQSATVGTVFAIPLQATVEDKYGNPVAGVVVTFNSPTSGPSGNFAGLRSATATTNALGVATAPAFTAGLLVGSYAVVATAPGLSSSAAFNLTNRTGPTAPAAGPNPVLFNRAAAITAASAGGADDSAGESAPIPVQVVGATPGDFDGDGRADVALDDAAPPEFLIVDSDGGRPVRRPGDPKHPNRPA